MEWRAITGYEHYEISSEGGLVRNKEGKILKTHKNHNGYLQVVLHDNGKKQCFRIHRLVADAFIPNPNGYETINHIDHNKLNNDVNNLEWMPRGNNAKDGNEKKVYCYELDQTFDSIRKAGIATGIAESSIGLCCQGRYETAGNMHWEYVKS